MTMSRVTVEGAQADAPPADEAAPDAAKENAAPRFRRKRKVPWARIVLFLAALGGGGAFVAKKLAPLSVETVAATRGTAIEAIYATGTVEAYDRVLVKAKVTGSIVEFKVREGDHVKKGDLLARIDSPTLKFDLAKGKADLWAAAKQAGVNAPQIEALESQAKMTEADLKSATDDRDRLDKLVTAGAATQADLDRANAKVAALAAQLSAQQASRRSLRIELTAKASGSSAAVDALEQRLLDAEVRAPIDGIVLAKSVEQGEVVAVNAPLFKIGDTKHLVLECAIDEADVGKISVAKPAAIDLYAFPGRAVRGKVLEILPDADRTKKTFLAKLDFIDPPDGLRSGMSAEVNVIVEEHSGALLLPTEGVDAAGDAWMVENGRLVKRHLKTGVRDMLKVEVLGGLSDGEQVVVAPNDGLSQGARAKTKLRATTFPSSSTTNAPKAKPATL